MLCWATVSQSHCDPVDLEGVIITTADGPPANGQIMPGNGKLTEEIYKEMKIAG